MLRHAIFLVGCSLLVAGCHPLPDGRIEQALYIDVHRVVKVHEEDHWGLDRVEIEQASSTSADAVCSTDAATRANLGRWLDEHISLGDAAAASTRRMRRVRAVLTWWQEHGAECEGVEQRSDYDGIHGRRSSFVLLIDAVVSFNGYIRENRLTMGPGLGIRIMPAWGIGRYTLAFGLETASLMEFRRDLIENEVIMGARVVANIPLLLRIHDLGTTYDFEIALSTRLKPSVEPEMPPGARFAFGYGTESLRNDAILKYLTYWISYEVQPPRNGWPLEHILRIGTRVGTDIHF